MSEVKLLKFKISSALKNIIGKDLITDDFIAVFELIKNSFDAHAKNVEVRFEPDRLILIDDGKGMTFEDLTNKWLFVAYSAKKDGSEDSAVDEDYRNEIIQKRHYAGAKGVGRFSCDRLGNNLRLITKAAGVNSNTHELIIDWEEFERSSEDEFEDINVKHAELSNNTYSMAHGTALEISNLRAKWPREKILQLKRSLEKLIHPYDGNSAEEFSIIVKAEHEELEDLLETDQRKMVNGPVKNFIFEQLSIKTTQVVVTISKDGKLLTTELVDRGNPIYKIEEQIADRYPDLKDVRFQLYYLNRSAKYTFKSSMGIRSFEFGSVFLYKNGFRVYPYGEPGEDDFKIDQRHAQGYSRTLGLRDLIGRIEIYGDNYQFTETTSRDGGLIQTSAYVQLVSCFMEKCFLRLEKYVTGIHWPVGDTTEDISLLDNLSSKSRIADLVAKLVDSDDIRLLSYNKDFLNILGQKTEDALPAFTALKKIANTTNDHEFIEEIQSAEAEYKKLILAEEEARKNLYTQEAARRKAEEEKAKAEEAFLLERKKNLFFNATSHNNDAVLGLIHHIKLTSGSLDVRVKILSKDIRDKKYDEEKFLEILSEIQLISAKILSLSQLVTVSDLNFKYAQHEGDLAKFIGEYLHEISPLYKNLKILFEKVDGEKVLNFSILGMTVLFDNLISNSIKAGAKNLIIRIISIDPFVILVSDDGSGIDDSVKEKVFDIGFTTRRQGSGIGLANARDILAEVNGEITFKNNGLILKGACFEIII